MRQVVFGFTVYQTQDDEPVAGPIPTGLTIDIPGAAGGFPAASNVAMTTALPIDFTLTGNTISWTNSGEADAIVSITLSAFADSDFQTQVTLTCELVDDGSHEIAASVLPAGNNIEFPVFLGTRAVTRLTQVGNSVLILTATADGFLTR